MTKDSPRISSHPRVRQGLHLTLATAFAWLLLPMCASPGKEVELRLVRHDQPEVTVDKLEKQTPITNPVSTARGVEMMKIGVDYTGWGRNILLDGQPVFERYFQGKYIDRLPVAKPDLKPGDHTIWPGNHVFTVAADGSLSTKSGELLLENGVVKIKCYPVTLRAFVANPDEADLPMTMRVTPLPNLTLREAGNAEKNAPKTSSPKTSALDLLPEFDKFAPLTLWLPANLEGSGYLVHPIGLTFHLGAAGVIAGAAGGQSVPGLRVENGLIEIPLNHFPVIGDEGSKVVLTGVEQLTWNRGEAGQRKQVTLYPRKESFEFLITKPGPSLSLSAETLPFKSFRVDIPDAAKGAQRALVAELAERHFTPGTTVSARVRALDATPAHTAFTQQNKARAVAALATKNLQSLQAASAQAEQAAKAAAAKEEAAKRAVEPVKFKAADKAAALGAANAKLAEATAAVEKAKQASENANQTAEQLKKEVAEASTVAENARKNAPVALKAAQAAPADETLKKAAADAAKLVTDTTKTLDEIKKKFDEASKAAKTAQSLLPTLAKPVADATANLAKVEKTQAALPEVTDPVGGDLEDAKRDLAAAQKASEEALKAAEASKTPLPEASEAVRVANEAVDAATQKLEAEAPLNPLEKAAGYAQLQAYGSTEWQQLKSESGADGELKFSLPSAANGVYRLRLGVQVTGGAPLFAEQWISIAPPQPIGIGVFTQRGRSTFYRGESFWLGVAALGKEALPAGTMELDLVDSKGKRIPLLREQAAAARKQQTFIARLDGGQSLGLAAGRYRVEARFGAQNASAQVLEIVEPEPQTHFTNLLNGKYNVLGTGPGPVGYSHTIKSGEGAEELVSEITAMGYNAFMGMDYSMSRVHRHGLDLEQLVRERPELGPWESYYQPSGRDRFLNAALGKNLRFYENLLTQHDAMLPRDPQILDACDRYASLETAALRHSPAFHGLCLYDELYNSGDTDAPPAVVAMFFKAQEMAYRAKHPGYTSADAAKALDRFTSRPLGQRRFEDLAKFRTWADHEDSDWRTFSDRLSLSIKAVEPRTKLWTQYRAWGSNGGNISPNGLASDVFASLDIAATVMYKDGGTGDRPVFAPMMADVLRTREDLPVWSQIHNFHGSGLYGAHLFRQAMFGLSQKLDGLTYFTIEHNPIDPSPTDSRDTVRDIAGTLLTPYGDFFSSLNKGYKKVAILYSRESAHLAQRKQNKLNHTVEGLWVACMRAGFPADFVYDSTLRDPKGLEYDVIFAPGYAFEDEASPDILDALKRLVSAGKTIVVERSSKLPLEGISRLDSELDEYDDKIGGAFPRYVDFESEMVWNQSEQTTKLVRDFLSKKIKPAAEHSLLVGPDWLRRGKGEFLVLSNFAPTKFTDLHKTLYQAPDKPLLRFPIRPAHCYDVLEMRPVPLKTEGDWMSMEADMTHLAGKVFAFLPSPIDKVSLQANANLAAGADLSFQAFVSDGAGAPIDAAFPLEITLRDPEGNVQLHIYRAATPVFESAWRVPVNALGGLWKLTVRELISGASNEAQVTVNANPSPTVTATLDKRPVWLHDADKLRAFLAVPAAPGTTSTPEILIAVDNEQPWCKTHAEALASGLTQRGRPAKVVKVSDVLRIPNAWDKIPVLDGGRLWRGELVDPGLFVDAPLILLGRRYENRLIEALVRRDVLAEVPSTHLPAQGRAIVGWTRRAFSNFHDTVSIFANDEDGMKEGIRAFLESSSESSEPAVQKLAMAAFSKNALSAASIPAKAPSTMRDLLSSEDRIRAVDLDPKTGRVLASTFGFGHNLFCFGPDGALLWKQFLPDHNVYFAKWCDGGSRVVAATGQGHFLFLLNAADGTVYKKISSTEWPQFHWLNLEGAENTELQIVVNEPLRQVLVGGRTGLMALNFEGRKMWFHDRAAAIAAYPKEAEQSKAAAFGRSLHVGNFALHNDGSRLVLSEELIVGATPGETPGTTADLWAHTPKILDARSGKVLLENTEDPGNERSPGSWRVQWPSGSAFPFVQRASLSAPLTETGKLGPFAHKLGIQFSDGSQLEAARTHLARIAADGSTVWRTEGAIIWIPQLDAMNAAQSRFYRCDRDGLVRCFDLGTGKIMWDFKLPFHAVLQASGDELLAGANNGALVHLGGDGKPRWQTRLREHHELSGTDYGAYLAESRSRDVDSSGEFYPGGPEAPEDFKGVLRMGVEQLVNGDFESPASWQIENATVQTGAPAKTGSSALQLNPGQLATQRVSARVIPSATYLLEFWYRMEDSKTRLIAGALLEGEKQTLTSSRFEGRAGQWTFGRVALKSYADTMSIDIGFEAEGGKVSVDAASLRAVRFPSSNLLANPELHALDPVFVKDIRVQFERIPSRLREKMMTKNRVSAFAQGETNSAMIYTQEAAFLQNGRLDDVGNTWVYQPDPMAFALTLNRPAYISHLVLYLNNATPESAYRTISILANNMQTKIPETVSLVRMNQRRFIVVHFPTPLFTDSLKVIPSYYPAHTDSITEIELYGPIDGGKMATAVQSDADAVPMLMGSASRVFPKLPTDLVGPWRDFGPNRLEKYPPFTSGATVLDGMFSISDPNGAIRTMGLPKPDLKDPRDPKNTRVVAGPLWNLATLPPTTTPTRYKGRLLVGSSDYKLHAIADNGTYLWSSATGGRIYSSPAAQGDDVFFGSDDFRLYKVDVDSGILIWEFATGDKIRGGPALADNRVVAASWDGFVYALDAEAGRLLWKAPIAKYTRATPVIYNGKVFLGDEAGVAHCFEAGTGKELWKHTLDGFISSGAVVTPDGVFFATEQGDLAFLSHDGSPVWKRNALAGVSAQTVPTLTQLLVPTEKGLLVLRRSDGAVDERFSGPPVPTKILSVLKWREQLFLHTGNAWTDFRWPPRTYAEFENKAVFLVPDTSRPKEAVAQ